ncbi:MAG TPA: NTP transferase domain-containing protein, partial [Alphaproteobacteria bacterium]
MTKQPLTCIVLAAGQGKRMKSALPKALHPLAGRPLIGWLLETVESLSPQRIVVVTGPGMDDLREAVQPHETVMQDKPLGTGDAVKAALPALKNFTGDVLILLGDMPLISAHTLRALIAARHKESLTTGLSVLGAEFDPPPAFGRLMLDTHGVLEKIVEDKDCAAAERSIKLCNTGAFCVDGAKLGGWLGKIGNNNAQKEFYITDLVEIAAREGMNSHVHVTRDHAEVQGVNSRIDLAVLEDNVQQGLRVRAMENGATLIDPASVYFSWDTKTGRDIVIEP